MIAWIMDRVRYVALYFWFGWVLMNQALKEASDEYEE